MSEVVERMMKEYGVKPKLVPIPCEKCKHSTEYCQGIDCKVQEEYPPFTARKQIELIKLILSNSYNRGLFIAQVAQDEFCFQYGNDESISNHRNNIDFENTLADIVCDLGDELDTTKVREILNG